MKKKMIIALIAAVLLIAVIIVCYVCSQYHTVTVYLYVENGETYYSLKPANVPNVLERKLWIRINPDEDYYVVNHQYLYYNYVHGSKKTGNPDAPIRKKLNRQALYDLKNNKMISKDIVLIMDLHSFNEKKAYNIAVVRKNNQYYLYDIEKGQLISEKGYDNIGTQYNESVSTFFDSYHLSYLTVGSPYLSIQSNDKVGVFNFETQQTVLDTKYDSIRISENYFFVKLNDYGYLFDYDKNPLLSQYNVRDIWNDQYIVVQDQNIIKIVDFDGVVIASFHEDSNYEYSESSCCDRVIEITMIEKGNASGQKKYYQYHVDTQEVSYSDTPELHCIYRIRG